MVGAYGVVSVGPSANAFRVGGVCVLEASVQVLVHMELEVLVQVLVHMELEALVQVDRRRWCKFIHR